MPHAFKSCVACSVAFTILACATAGRPEESPGGRDHPLQDSFLDGLVGKWQVVRAMKNRTVENTVEGEWVLNHQFLRLHYLDVVSPPKYEAMVFIGYDGPAKQYVVHWIDVFGGQFSKTLGFGKREGNVLVVTFNYPDGEFQNTFTFDPKERTWNSLMRQKDKTGEWSTFAEDKFRSAAAK